MNSFLDQLKALTEIPTDPKPEVPVQLQSVVQTPIDTSIRVPSATEYREKGGSRHKLIFDGVCTHCAHCGQPLTDSVSAERGIGPICSKKGYLDEVVESDSTDALISLSEYPALVDYLSKKYKPQGNRGLVNGLVKTASLNRRSPVHGACTDAIEMLGFKRLASALRESLAVVSINKSKDRPEFYELWVKHSDFSWAWFNQIKGVPGFSMTKYPKKSIVVPVKYRVAVARSFVDHFSGLYLTTDAGSFKITEGWFDKVNAQTAS